MIRTLKPYHIIFTFLFLISGCNNGPFAIKERSEIERKIDSILNSLTLEEKIGQMTNIGMTALCKGDFWTNTDSLELDTAKLRTLIGKYKVGSVQNKGMYPPSREEWNNLTRAIQHYNTNDAKNKIPVLFGIDAVHGAHYTAGSTMFPHQLALAASWNTELAKQAGEVTAYELRASNLAWNYAPCLDIASEPLWGRFYETFGEDPLLTSEMGTAFIRGHQESHYGKEYSAPVCMKHFIGYGSPQNGKDRANAIIPMNYLLAYHLPPFEAGIQAGAQSVMLNSGAVNGIPGHANKNLITGLLKEKLGFRGPVISDWADIEKLVGVHRVAKDKKDAARIAVLAGLDMCMVPYDAGFADDVLDLVKEGQIPESRIDDAVRRILRLKLEAGLFEQEKKDPDYKDFGSARFAEMSYNAACQSIVLLKNEEQILPLSYNDKILVCGKAANSLNALNGAWSRTWGGSEKKYNDENKLTILEALQNEFGEANVHYLELSQETGLPRPLELEKWSKWADKVLICLGEKQATEKPSDIHELAIDEAQNKLVEKISRFNRNIISVLLIGRPRIVRDIEKVSKGIIMACLPGPEGGRALADVMSARFNPGGKLPFTWPGYSGEKWTYYHKQADEVDENFGMNGFNPQWEFGYGLSYTSFTSELLSIEKDTLIGNDSLNIRVKVTNTGSVSGHEVVQLYISDRVASISPDMKKLLAFKKVFLKAGEEQMVHFVITSNQLQFIDSKGDWIAEDGDFQILAGGNPKDMSSINFYYKNSK